MGINMFQYENTKLRFKSAIFKSVTDVHIFVTDVHVWFLVKFSNFSSK